MTGLGTSISAALAAVAVAAGGAVGGDSEPDASARGAALVIDAAVARDGRELVDRRLHAADAAVRLPRTSAEARTDLRYLAAQGYRLVVTGPMTVAAVGTTGVVAARAADISGALAVAR
jgi:hypothetical protein